MDIYLAGDSYLYDCLVKYLSGEFIAGKERDTYMATLPDKSIDIPILWNFVEIREMKWRREVIPKIRNFILDSGAFTFIAKNSKAANKEINWEAYINEYAALINEYKIEHFIELDIDALVGYEKVKEYRRILERKTNRQSIPVWHKSRGKAEFIRLCKKYDYVAIGGIVTKEIKRSEHKYFPYFINEAHRHGIKIHGLGYTFLGGLTKYHFDSVDSSSWTAGNRFGGVYHFNGKTLKKIDTPANHRLINIKNCVYRNFNEWVKFQKYAKNNL